MKIIRDNLICFKITRYNKLPSNLAICYKLEDFYQIPLSLTFWYGIKIFKKNFHNFIDLGLNFNLCENESYSTFVAKAGFIYAQKSI